MNIAEILKDKPEGTELYSPAYGEVIFNGIKNDAIYITDKRQIIRSLNNDGKLFNNGECMLFPSKCIRDWKKFAWEKGDVLMYIDTKKPYYAIFEEFQDDKYATFKSCYNYDEYKHWIKDNNTNITNNFVKLSDEDAKMFIKKLEEHYKGKLNLETLEIEKEQGFKDGDIVFTEGNREVSIFKSLHSDTYDYYACLSDGGTISYDIFSTDMYLRPATDSEKQQLFEALAKENKAWDAEKKQIVDLQKKCEFKPMDWCLMRNKNSLWHLCQFAFKFILFDAVGGNIYAECIPYNEETKHLLGTTDEWKGGKK